MSVQLVMASPGQPVVHNALHDLESFFYILVRICVLYDGPSKQKSEADLTECFDRFFNTFKPSVLKTITIQSDLTWTPLIVKHIHPYFKSIIPLLSHLQAEIILPLAMDECGDFYRKATCNHDTFIKHIVTALSELQPEDWNDASLQQKNNSSFHQASLEAAPLQSKSRPPKFLLLLAPPTAPKHLPPGRATIRSDLGLHQPVERCLRQAQKPKSDSDDFVPSSPTKRVQLDPYQTPSGSHLHLKRMARSAGMLHTYHSTTQRQS